MKSTTSRAIAILALGAGAYVWHEALYSWSPEHTTWTRLAVAATFVAPMFGLPADGVAGARYHRIKLGTLCAALFLALAWFACAVADDGMPNTILDPRLLGIAALVAWVPPALGAFAVTWIPARLVPAFSHKLNITLFTFALLFVVLEVWVRVTPEPDVPRRVSEPWFEANDSGRPRYRVRPDHDFVFRFPSDPRGYFGPEGTVVHRVNANGYRGPLRSATKPDEVRRILILGDSYAFGWGVHDADTCGALLERALAERGLAVEVITLAAPGYNTTDQRDALLAQGLELDPDLVIVWYAINDVGGDWDPREEEAGRARFESDKPWWLRWSQGADRIHRAAIQLLGKRRFTRRQIAEYTHDGPEWRRGRAALVEMRDRTREHGARIALAIEPMLVNLERRSYRYRPAHESIARFCRQAEIPCYDLYQPIAGRDPSRLIVHPTDIHSNDVAKRTFVEFLVPRLLADGLL